MKKTYITTMPDNVGAFLKASRLIYSLGLNITRVSYNKAIDTHTLFIEAEGEPYQLERVKEMLKDIGYISEEDKNEEMMLIEFRIEDKPGSICKILEIIKKYNLNISYISSQENGSEYQYFRMGLFVSDHKKLNDFLEETSKMCLARIIDYDHREKNFDNEAFYKTYATELSSLMKLDGSKSRKLLVNINRAVQLMDEHNIAPYTTFDCISKIASLLSQYKGENFNPRITVHEINQNVNITVIEPPCGSNVTIIESNGKYLFVDTGYACYRDEMTKIFKELIPDFDSIERTAVITHPDVDHCGLLTMFDTVYMSANSMVSLTGEQYGKGFREQNPLHFPYIRICKLLTGYESPDESKLKVIGGETCQFEDTIKYIGELDFENCHFKVFEGKGGHVSGEMFLVDYENRLLFTGDIYVNIKGFTKEQAEYNKYAPVLMTGVDTDQQTAAEERADVFSLLTEGGEWFIFPGHGEMKKMKGN